MTRGSGRGDGVGGGGAAIKLPVMAPYHSEWNCSSIHRRDRPPYRPRPPYRLYGVISLIKMSSARYILATNFPLESETGAGRRTRVGLAGIIAASSSSWGDRENRSISVPIPIKSRRTSKKETNKSPLMIFPRHILTACVRDSIFLLEREGTLFSSWPVRRSIVDECDERP